jgi:hypothetical protein
MGLSHSGLSRSVIPASAGIPSAAEKSCSAVVTRPTLDCISAKPCRRSSSGMPASASIACAIFSMSMLHSLFDVTGLDMGLLRLLIQRASDPIDSEFGRQLLWPCGSVLPDDSLPLDSIGGINGRRKCWGMRARFVIKENCAKSPASLNTVSIHSRNVQPFFPKYTALHRPKRPP